MAKNTINSGQLNQRIEIYASEDQDNGSGGTNPMSILYWSTNAQVLPLKSNRSLQANQELLKDGFKFTIRDRNDKTIHPYMQIKYRGSWLTIQSAIPDYVYREFMVVTAIWAERPERIAI